VEENLVLAILNVVSHAPLRSRRLLMRSIVVCGGLSLTPGLEDRLISEIYARWGGQAVMWKDTLGVPMKPQILHGPLVSSLSAFVGASIMTMLQTEAIEGHEKAETRQARRRSRGSIYSFASMLE
jgi:actin-related protein